jgi:hypothetical protein
MEKALRRLDHLVCVVPDIQVALKGMNDAGFPTAWPIGPFWPNALTCGVSLGNMNLEFVEPERDKPERPTITTLVFEPTSLEAAEQAFAREGIPVRRFEKIEPNPELLRLRGFDEEDAKSPQLICTNLLLDEPRPVEMFLCLYTPFLSKRLGPTNPALRTSAGEVKRLVLDHPEPEKVAILDRLGLEQPLDIQVRQAPVQQVSTIYLTNTTLSFS